MEFEKIAIKEEFIRLDSAMKLASLVSTGGHAKMVIQNGEVKVAAGEKLSDADMLSMMWFVEGVIGTIPQ